ncbi:hypothetical protein [Streptomyces sp. GS7]|uniref:hypothetical protein n=1 Tax=Streptomyces sp. GS7 TaxID=2692234 RepID=UPI00131837C1|nr:hypothetical protein [Streptomyces sp. GS7]QHC24874.1 hypothetical protein GR130_29385 [Streptomyces sp. GS7]
MSTQVNIHGNPQEGAVEGSGATSKWRRRLTRLGVYGLFAVLAGTAATATAAPAAQSRAVSVAPVSITCRNGTGTVVKTDNDPGKPVMYQATGTCSVTGTENGKASGTATFSINKNNCVNATTPVTGTIAWPDGTHSTVTATVVWAATAGKGITASISSGSITSGAFAGTVVSGTATAAQQVEVNCVTSGTFDGATGSGSGAVTGS